MFDALAAAVEELLGGVPCSGEAVVELVGLHDRLGSIVSGAIGALDASEEWGLDGSVSCAAWLRRHTGMTPGAAKRATVTASRVRRSPPLRDAWAEGQLSSGQVDVIVANVAEELVELWEQHEATVVPSLVPLSIRDTATAMQTWAARARIALALEGPEPDRPDTLHVSTTLDGRGRIDGNLAPDVARLAAKAIDLATSKDAEGEERSPAQRRHDALGDIFAWYLGHQTVRLGGRKRPHVSVTIDLESLRRGEGGTDLYGHPIDPASMGALLCDANIHRVIRDGASSILDYGRATRTIPPALYESLYLRDLGCRFPGCDRPGEWCDGHHVQWWEPAAPPISRTWCSCAAGTTG
jgi:hypothetical protein